MFFTVLYQKKMNRFQAHFIRYKKKTPAMWDIKHQQNALWDLTQILLQAGAYHHNDDTFNWQSWPNVKRGLTRRPKTSRGLTAKCASMCQEKPSGTTPTWGLLTFWICVMWGVEWSNLVSLLDCFPPDMSFCVFLWTIEQFSSAGCVDVFVACQWAFIKQYWWSNFWK